MSKNAIEKDRIQTEIDELRREVGRLTEIRDDLVSSVTVPAGGSRRSTDSGRSTGSGSAGADSCVFDDDDAGARAFDEFYRAYDEVHDKTRKFLLG